MYTKTPLSTNRWVGLEGPYPIATPTEVRWFVRLYIDYRQTLNIPFGSTTCRNHYALARLKTSAGPAKALNHPAVILANSQGQVKLLVTSQRLALLAKSDSQALGPLQREVESYIILR